MNNEHTVRRFLEGTKRVYNYEIRGILSLLDEAYWASETDEEILRDADRPLVNDSEKAKTLLLEAISKMENLEDVMISKMDLAVYDLKEAARSIGNLKITAYLEEQK